MNQNDLIRAARAIEPGRELKMKILKSAAHPRGFRLDHPMRIATAFGAAIVLCACAVGAVIAFAGNGPHKGAPAALLASKPSTTGTAAAPNASPWPSAAEATPNDSPTAASDSAFALPDGAIPPEQALALACQTIHDLFGDDVGDYIAIQGPTRDMAAQSEEGLSKEQPRLLDSGKPADMSQYKNTDKKYVEFWLLDYTKGNSTSKLGLKTLWRFYFLNGAQSICMDLDGSTGYAIGAVTGTEEPTNVNATAEKLVKQKYIVQEFVENLQETNGATVTKTEGKPDAAKYADYYVYLNDGRYVRVILDNDDKVMSFTFLPPKDPNPQITPQYSSAPDGTATAAATMEPTPTPYGAAAGTSTQLPSD